jgi:hypothetical protein
MATAQSGIFFSTLRQSTNIIVFSLNFAYLLAQNIFNLDLDLRLLRWKLHLTANSPLPIDQRPVP